jgi:hypothetical protein
MTDREMKLNIPKINDIEFAISDIYFFGFLCPVSINDDVENMLLEYEVT